ncbi:hypothetical protein FBUS_00117 [Fasciolopsis buskii]|uniref:Transmembrane protein 242 n=1 Tax=Fasciolopsis buskii TaxID=27845 RepID=A0A8E0VPD8_9TREM|nr:hypothetical protein FBUS_00117 [Fasciolopsis buski]
MAWQVDLLCLPISVVAVTLSAFGLSALIGFSITLYSSRKIEPSAFAKQQGLRSVANVQNSVIQESAVRFAVRALGLGTALAVLGVGGLAGVAWKLSGARDFVDLNDRFKSAFPEPWKVKSANPATNFETFGELLHHITTDSSKKSRGS